MAFHSCDCVVPCFEQGGCADASVTDWSIVRTWLGTFAGSVLLCIENAEEPLRATIAQVNQSISPSSQGRQPGCRCLRLSTYACGVHMTALTMSWPHVNR